MFNTQKPSLEELPSSTQLLRSTIAAALAAVAILFVIVLPAEYGIDPTGAGRMLGLTEMGEIKQELEDEAERDRILHGDGADQSSLLDTLFGLFVSTAYAQDSAGWTDEIVFTLQPGETYEVKLSMKKGAATDYVMVVEGGRVNFDLHGHGSGESITYEKGRGSRGTEGRFAAAFDGGHGWFWRNRDSSSLTVTLKIRGVYDALTQGS